MGPEADGWSYLDIIKWGDSILPKTFKRGGDRRRLHQDRWVQKRMNKWMKDECRMWVARGMGVALGLSTCMDENMDEGPFVDGRVMSHSEFVRTSLRGLSGQWMSLDPAAVGHHGSHCKHGWTRCDGTTFIIVWMISSPQANRSMRPGSEEEEYFRGGKWGEATYQAIIIISTSKMEMTQKGSASSF